MLPKVRPAHPSHIVTTAASDARIVFTLKADRVFESAPRCVDPQSPLVSLLYLLLFFGVASAPRHDRQGMPLHVTYDRSGPHVGSGLGPAAAVSNFAAEEA